MRLGAGGDKMELMIADGMPMQVPQILVQIPSRPPHIPNGDGGEHDGGAQGGGAQGAGSGPHAGGPPAIVRGLKAVAAKIVRHKAKVATLFTIPHPPLFRSFNKHLRGVTSSEGN
jgi:hypothetical protein